MRPHPNVFHGAAIVTVAGLVIGLALKPTLKDPDPKHAAPAATDAAPVQVARSGPTPWWVIGSDALYGRAQPQVTLARAEALAEETPARLEVYPPAIAVPPPTAAPEQRFARAEPPAPRPAGGEWREDAEGVYFVPEDEAYPPEPAHDYDPYA